MHSHSLKITSVTASIHRSQPCTLHRCAISHTLPPASWATASPASNIGMCTGHPVPREHPRPEVFYESSRLARLPTDVLIPPTPPMPPMWAPARLLPKPARSGALCASTRSPVPDERVSIARDPWPLADVCFNTLSSSHVYAAPRLHLQGWRKRKRLNGRGGTSSTSSK